MSVITFEHLPARTRQDALVERLRERRGVHKPASGRVDQQCLALDSLDVLEIYDVVGLRRVRAMDDVRNAQQLFERALMKMQHFGPERLPANTLSRDAHPKPIGNFDGVQADASRTDYAQGFPLDIKLAQPFEGHIPRQIVRKSLRMLRERAIQEQIDEHRKDLRVLRHGNGAFS